MALLKHVTLKNCVHNAHFTFHLHFISQSLFGQLQGAQRRYSELECLAIFKSVNHFAHYIYGRKFTAFTDHKALASLLKSRVLNRRLQGWMLQQQEFDFIIKYKPGVENADADALSR